MLKFFVIFSAFSVAFGNPITSGTYQLENAPQTESPWFALIHSYTIQCGGSLISNRFVITAAHCFDDLKEGDWDEPERLLKAVIVKLGEWNTKTDPDCDEEAGGELCEPIAEIPAKAIVRHEDYSKERGSKRFGHDIAIVKLSWPPRQSALIQNVQLPDAEECRAPLHDVVWTMTGFGQTPEKEYTVIKKKIEMSLISHEECENDVGTSKQFYDKLTHICGKGSRGESTCLGDSGSGLVSKNDNEIFLEGIVSFGTSECGTNNAPSGFVRVACFKEWIETQLVTLSEDDETDTSGDDDGKESNRMNTTEAAKKNDEVDDEEDEDDE